MKNIAIFLEMKFRLMKENQTIIKLHKQENVS